MREYPELEMTRVNLFDVVECDKSCYVSSVVMMLNFVTPGSIICSARFRRILSNGYV